jgi:hypothetical protein
VAESPTRWHCGCLIGAGGHQTRGEAARCYHAQREPQRAEAALQSYMPAPLRVYDITLDALRELTQRDLEEYWAVSRAYSRIRQAYKEGRDLREAVEVAHAQLMAAIGEVEQWQPGVSS